MTRFSDLLGRDDASADEESAPRRTGELAKESQLAPEADPGRTPETFVPEHRAPARGIGRDVFSELADEQAAVAEQETEADQRVRELGLEALPAVEDDFLPGH